MDARHSVIETDLGPVVIEAQGDSITGMHFLRPTEDPLLAEAGRQVRDYLAGRRTGFDLPLAADGDAFQHAVWDIVRGIPRGETTSYGHIAERVGGRGLAQRVGQAVGANPLLIVVPCHRVVGADGSLTGYAGGLRRKRALLELEEPATIKAGRLF